MALRWEDMLLGAEPRPSLVFRRWRSPLRGWHCYFRRCESQSLCCGHCRKNMKKLVHVADVAWKIRTLVAPCWCMFGGQRLVNANPHVDFPQVNDNWTSCRRVMTSFLKVDPLSERSGIPDTFFLSSIQFTTLLFGTGAVGTSLPLQRVTTLKISEFSNTFFS